MKRFYLPIILIALFACFVALPVFVLAEDVVAPQPWQDAQLEALAGTEGANYGTAQDPRVIITYIIQILLGTLGTAFLAYLVYGGFLIVTSGGEEEKQKKGSKTIKYAIIGTIIIFSSYAITIFISKYLLEANTPINGPGSDSYWQIKWGVEKKMTEYYPDGGDYLGGSNYINEGGFFDSGEVNSWD